MFKMSGVSKSKSRDGSFLASDEFSMTSEYREAISIFEKFDKYELQENLAHFSTNWLLSNDDFKMIMDPPNGICKNMPTITKEWLTVLYPYEDDVDHLDYREIFQIIRELTIGIFGCNQTPGLNLEANFDQSTQCQLPPAYIDTRVGQHMITVDYVMKGLWHGAFFPADMRRKWSEKWRSTLDVNYQGQAETKLNIFDKFSTAGLLSMDNDQDYSSSYRDFTDILQKEKLCDSQTEELFRSRLSSLEMRLSVVPKHVSRFDEIFVLESDWSVETIIKTVAEDLDVNKSEILTSVMRLHKGIIESNIAKKQSIRRSLYLLKLISSIIPLFIGLKKRMRIPDLTKMMNPLTGDDVHTEKELPPLITGEGFPNIFFKSKDYFHLHGGVQFGLDTPIIGECNSNIRDPDTLEEIRRVALEASYVAQSQSTDQNQNPVRTVTDLSGKIYYLIPLAMEIYYNQAPKKPNWVRAIGEESLKLQNKKLPLSDNAMHEQFKTFFGLNEAIKNKNIITALKTCSKRGLVAMLQTLCKKCSVSRVSKQDELGWSLMHHAAMENKAHLIGALILQSQDVNVRRYNTVSETSPTPLHLAAICGSLNAAACLVGCGANLKSADKAGWMPIHCAAFHDKVAILLMFVARDSDLKNIHTRNVTKSTPTLLAASSGSLCSLKVLLALESNVKYKDAENRGVVHMATLSHRTQIIEYFVDLNLASIPVWAIFLEMLQSKDPLYVQSTVTCLQLMTKFSRKHFPNILASGSVHALVDLLKTTDSSSLLSSTSSVLCNICVDADLQLEMSKTPMVEISIRLFELQDLELKSQVAFILSNMCRLDSCQQLFASLQGYKSLCNMISEAKAVNDVSALVNGVQAIESLCRDNPANQNVVVSETCTVDHLVEFLGFKVGETKGLVAGTSIDVLLSSSSLAIASIVRDNPANQDILVMKKCVAPLLDLLKNKTNVSVQVAAANAVENLCVRNDDSREAFLAVQSELALIHLLKIWSLEVKEQGLRSLWALAGDHISGQRFVAEQIGASLLIELIMTKSETLQSIGCGALAALSKEVKVNQDLIHKEGGIAPLVRLLRQKTSPGNVLTETVKTLAILCIGVAHCNNMAVQSKIILEGAFSILTEIFKRPSTETALKIEIGYTMAALTLNHKTNQMSLIDMFDFCDLLQIMSTVSEKTLLLRCLTTLAVFGFNNTDNQFAIKQSGGLSYEIFEYFLNSDDRIMQCQAAFNMVVLAKDIVDRSQVMITSVSVRILFNSLKCEENHIVILAADLIASLCHTRAGIPDAFVSLGVIELLLQLLHSANAEVRSASAVALGYLSFNATAARILLKQCRIHFTLFDKFITEIETMDSKVCDEFVESYRRAEKVGLPYKYLECNGGYSLRIKSSVSRNVKSGVTRISEKTCKPTRPATALPSSSYKY